VAKKLNQLNEIPLIKFRVDGMETLNRAILGGVYANIVMADR
jgi:hypothetical protein